MSVIKPLTLVINSTRHLPAFGLTQTASICSDCGACLNSFLREAEGHRSDEHHWLTSSVKMISCKARPEASLCHLRYNSLTAGGEEILLNHRIGVGCDTKVYRISSEDKKLRTYRGKDVRSKPQGATQATSSIQLHLERLSHNLCKTLIIRHHQLIHCLVAMFTAIPPAMTPLCLGLR